MGEQWGSASYLGGARDGNGVLGSRLRIQSCTLSPVVRVGVTRNVSDVDRIPRLQKSNSNFR